MLALEEPGEVVSEELVVDHVVVVDSEGHVELREVHQEDEVVVLTAQHHQHTTVAMVSCVYMYMIGTSYYSTGMATQS